MCLRLLWLRTKLYYICNLGRSLAALGMAIPATNMRGDIEYAEASRTYMTQAAAVKQGFRPADNRPCQ